MGPNSITHGSSSLVRRRILSFCISPAGAVLVCRPLFAEERIRRIRRVPISANARVGVWKTHRGSGWTLGSFGSQQTAGPLFGKEKQGDVSEPGSEVVPARGSAELLNTFC